MNHYNYPQRLKTIWTEAIEKYEAGHQKPEDFIDNATLAELATYGLNVMDVFDPVEDHLSGAEIDFETFLLVSTVRRDYFLTTQKSVTSEQTLDPGTLPAKDLAINGIVWLPRIMPKALAKLRGELPASTMYGCGGDRRFLKANDIHPAEFLRVVWAYEDDHSKIIEWVEARRATTLTAGVV